MPGSSLLEYYRGSGTDHAGRHLDDVLAWDDDALEQVHDYIQWVFPNVDPSRANSAAPLLTAADVAEFRGDGDLQRRLLDAFERILRFYGYRRSTSPDGGVTLEPLDTWRDHAANWLQPYNHNHLRLTRIMKCLAALGRSADAEALQQTLLALADSHPRAVSAATKRYWKSALNG